MVITDLTGTALDSCDKLDSFDRTAHEINRIAIAVDEIAHVLEAIKEEYYSDKWVQIKVETAYADIGKCTDALTKLLIIEMARE